MGGIFIINNDKENMLNLLCATLDRDRLHLEMLEKVRCDWNEVLEWTQKKKR